MADLASLYARQNASNLGLLGLVEQRRKNQAQQGIAERKLQMDEGRYRIELEKHKQDMTASLRDATKEQRENAQAAVKFGSRIAQGVVEQDNPLGFLEGRSMAVRMLQNNGLGDLVQKYDLPNAPKETWAFLARLGLDLSKAPELTSFAQDGETVTRETTPLGGTQEIGRGPRWKPSEAKPTSILLPDGSTTGGRTMGGQLQVQNEAGEWVSAPAGAAPFTRRVDATSTVGLADAELPPPEQTTRTVPPGASLKAATGPLQTGTSAVANYLLGAVGMAPADPEYDKSSAFMQGLVSDTLTTVGAEREGRPSVFSMQEVLKTLPKEGDTESKADEKVGALLERIDERIAIAQRDIQRRGASRKFRQDASSRLDRLQQLKRAWSDFRAGFDLKSIRDLKVGESYTRGNLTIKKLED